MPARALALGFLVVALILLCAAAVAAPAGPRQVPEASAIVLAPIGIAAAIAAERRRRRLADIRAHVGLIYFFIKRLTDIMLATLLLLVFLPLFAAIALMVRLDSRGPILFRRRVIGEDGNRFDMFKFRSMVEGAEEILAGDEDLRKEYYVNCKLKEDPRITRLGRFLRKTSLDELPQLLNIFMGNMTFVGPRPIAEDEVEIYGPAVERFKTVTPGITGLWQTCGRSDAPYDKRVQMDLFYIENRSILMDLWIILATIPAVLLKRGAC